MPTPDGTDPEPLDPDPIESAASSLAALADPIRRRLYRFVMGEPGAVSREQGAAGIGVPGHTAKFHLDRLVDDGLLDVEFRRLSGKTGPGAGRPAKLYRRSRRQIVLSLPQRSYDLLSTILARGVEEAVAAGTSMGDVTARVSREEGHALGTTAAQEVPEGDSLERLAWSLQPHGYEPRIEDDRMVLENCPFDKVARDHTDAGVRAQPRVRRRCGRGPRVHQPRRHPGAFFGPVLRQRPSRDRPSKESVSIETRCPPERR